MNELGMNKILHIIKVLEFKYQFFIKLLFHIEIYLFKKE